MRVVASLGFPTASELIAAFFRTLERWMAAGTTWVLGETWRALSATTEPVLTGTAFDSEYHAMVLIGAGVLLPLLGLAVIQAVAHQDVSGLLRTAVVRLPMAVVLSGVVIEIVSLGLTATDRASASLLATGGAPAASVFLHLEAALVLMGDSDAAAFGGLLLVAVVAVVSFVLWVELAVRSAAVAVAALFLPLALAGLVWPATSHWARRLGETLASLVLMKLVMAAVLALAAGALVADSGGVASVVEGLSLLGLTAFSPYALFRLVPMVEAGAVSHLEGVRAASAVKSFGWSMATSALSGLGSGGGGMSPPASATSAPVPNPGPSGGLYGSEGGRDPGGPSGGEPGGPGTSDPDGSGPGAGGPGAGGGGTRARGSASESGGAGDTRTPTGRIGQQGWEQRMTNRAAARAGGGGGDAGE